ncbi:uncharacterized protein KIAA1211-like homolog isoform X2 [Seriola dumerili]|uniref:uncharacterized protein KIAA1211-like homolog isoform X2 n=1 Tax=Seriola dumerili TaxID=41447 RepID=UPI000BBE3D9B|nr:uncharacterized protein KIAA1211-like homolog isoform X2 [Seriola dumerili]
MESFSGDIEESTEDIPGRKKSKLKSLKTRLFGRNKRTGGEGDAKISQSASDITAGKGLGSDEDLVCSQGTMGSRALSHDSIFLADQVLTDTEPARVLSQENVHSKIKALQMKLQQQKMHLGPPPLVVPIRRPEDLGSRSEDDSLLHSPPEVSGGDVTSQGAFTKGELKKAQTEVQTSAESPALAKTTPLSKDTKPEGRQGVKLAESSPTKVPDRPREDKWLRKNMASSSPSSSPTQPSVLQSMSESGQPSWMELAKRKSMAWSDKTMD